MGGTIWWGSCVSPDGVSAPLTSLQLPPTAPAGLTSPSPLVVLPFCAASWASMMGWSESSCCPPMQLRSASTLLHLSWLICEEGWVSESGGWVVGRALLAAVLTCSKTHPPAQNIRPPTF